MSYVYYNANPARKSHGDCVIRALSKVMDLTWEQVAIDLSMMQVTFHEMQNNDHVWGTFLSLNGFEKGMLPYPCPNCITIKDFCKLYPYGKYVVATGEHVVAVVDGDYYDTDDTGNEVLIYFWKEVY